MSPSSAPASAPAKSNPVDTLLELVGPELDSVNNVIVERMQSPVPLIPKLAGHLIQSGGKRLRPILTLASAKMCGYEGQRHVDLAACVEFIHTATLLHDDVVDESDLRRGKQTANALWGNQASVLVGDFLFSRSFQLMVKDGSLRVLDILSTASAVIAEGEVLQLVMQKDLKSSLDDYLRMIHAKTAALFAAATEVGAVVAEVGPEKEQALRDYGDLFGVAFQLIDDVLDYAGDAKKTGKTVGDDFAEGKITLPVLLAQERGTAEEQEFWKRTITIGRQEDGDLEQAIALMHKYDALADTRQRAVDTGNEAIAKLSGFADNAERQALADLVEFCIYRDH